MDTALDALVVLLLIVALQRALFVGVIRARVYACGHDAPVYIAAYFALWVGMLYALFMPEVHALISSVRLPVWAGALLGVFVVVPYVYRLLCSYDGDPAWLAQTYPTRGFLSREQEYVLAKFSEVLFSQLAIGIAVLILATAGIAYPTIVMVCLVVFVGARGHLFFTSGALWGVYCSMWAVAGACVFPFLVLFVDGGVVYALGAHLMYYAFSAALFSRFTPPRMGVAYDVLAHHARPSHARP